MSVSCGVYGIVPANEEYKKMYTIYKMCKEAEVEVPKEIREFFNNDEPDEKGMKVYLGSIEGDGGYGGISYVTRGEDESSIWIDVDIMNMPSNIRMLRFEKSW